MSEPISLAAAKYETAEDSSKVTPRETLVEILRMIDAGEISPTAMLVACETDTGEETRRDYFTAGATYGEAYILASHLKARTWEYLRPVGGDDG